jgi:hypothetical protein
MRVIHNSNGLSLLRSCLVPVGRMFEGVFVQLILCFISILCIGLLNFYSKNVGALNIHWMYNGIFLTTIFLLFVKHPLLIGLLGHRPHAPQSAPAGQTRKFVHLASIVVAVWEEANVVLTRRWGQFVGDKYGASPLSIMSRQSPVVDVCGEP